MLHGLIHWNCKYLYLGLILEIRWNETRLTKSIQVNKINRACGSYQNFLDRGLLLTNTLLIKGFLGVTLKSLLLIHWNSKYFYLGLYLEIHWNETRLTKSILCNITKSVFIMICLVSASCEEWRYVSFIGIELLYYRPASSYRSNLRYELVILK